ncbi:hypothetical protein [Corynebacterium phocae]|uniref:hypothetical protein n=1 Tax=Corynebacterium phocae TaxID=161895 RepID=UPI0020127091|nr:hypothetical protein [Corynebacterium phocae]
MAGRVAALRAQIAQVEGASPADSAPPAPEVDVVELPGTLGRLLPGGGLARRQVTELSDCPALAADLVAKISAAGGYVAVVGWVELSLAHVAEEGDLSKVVAVPDPGARPWDITCVLLEGMDLVIHHGAANTLSPTKARPVMAKLRGGNAALVTVGPHLPGTAVKVSGEVTTYRGIGRGTGRIKGIDIAVGVRTKSGQPQQGTLTLGTTRRLELA